MNTYVKCSRCGAPRPAGSTAELCPGCLFDLASDEHTEPKRNPDDHFNFNNRKIGDYILIRQIGSGGMGVVYEARQASLNRKVAVKLMRDFLQASPTILRRFAIEAEAAARLTHPNIVPIYEIGEMEGMPFYSMNYIEGESLKDIIASKNTPANKPHPITSLPDWRDEQIAIVKVLAKLGSAVAHAHQRGVLHRDIKPANIIIDRQGEPYLLDFGLAKLLEQQDKTQSITSTDEFAGTPCFMSPEQASCAATTSSSDIYGLGAVMYVLLTGKPPFRGATPLETVRQVIGQPPAFPRSIQPKIHPDLETICLKCLEKDPQHRYSSATAFVEDLECWQSHQPIKAKPAGVGTKMASWIRRNPIGTALIATLLAGLIATIFLYLDSARKKNEIDRMLMELGQQYEKKMKDSWYKTNSMDVTINYMELGAFYGRSPIDIIPKYELTLGVLAGSEPASDAQRYSQQLAQLEQRMSAMVDGPVVFNLRLFKLGSVGSSLVGHNSADIMVVPATDYLIGKKHEKQIHILAAEKKYADCVVFSRKDTGIARIEDLVGKSVAFQGPYDVATILTKARLVESGIFATNLALWKHFADSPLGQENSREAIIAYRETVVSVKKTNYLPLFVAGVTTRRNFEMHRANLVELDAFSTIPMLYVASPNLNPKLASIFRRAATQLQFAVPFEKQDQLAQLEGSMDKARQFDGKSLFAE